MRLTIGRKLGLGFGAILVSMAAGSAVIHWKVYQLRQIHHRVIDLRYPAAQARERLINSVNQSLDEVRGHIIPHTTGEKCLDCDGYTQAWQQIDSSFEAMQRLFSAWSKATQPHRLMGILKNELEALRSDQKEILAVTHAEKNVPALHLLLKDGAPQAAVILKTLTGVIDEEVTLEATQKRKTLLKNLGDSSSSFAAALASMRAYVMSGDQRFSKSFERSWEQNQAAYQLIQEKIALLTVSQRPLWDTYARLRRGFVDLSSRMFEMRDAADWNVANFMLVTKVTPRADRIKSILNEIAASHRRQMEDDKQGLEEVARAMENAVFVATACAMVIALLVAAVFSQRIVGSIHRLMVRAEAIADGDLSGQPLKPRAGDELGQLTIAINDMSESLSNRVKEITDRAQQLEVEVAERKRAEAQLLHVAHHDRLTGLANRELFTQRLSSAIERSRRDTGFIFSVMFMDVDRFKHINDTLGHEAGDLLLVGLAGRVREVLSQQQGFEGDDWYTVGRLGGDEFVVLLEGADTGVARLCAERIQESLSMPYDVCGRDIHVTASVGVVISDIGYKQCKDVLRDADQALYKAKTGGRARYEVFDKRMHASLSDRFNLEADLHTAIAKNQLKLRYHPIVCLESGRMTGFEALIRWEHPERGSIEPNEFLPVAQETGQIVPIDDWVFNQACQQLRTWQDRYPQRQLTMAVNLHKRHLMQPGLVDHVKTIINHKGVAPQAVTIEVTESTIMEPSVDIIPVLTQLRELGVKLSIDDFGSGNSSLSRLYELPVDQIKIDRAYIGAIETYQEYSAIVNAIVTVAHSFGMTAVAEGIDTPGKLAHLQALECDFAQGYYFARPLDVETAEHLLATADEAAFKVM